MNQKVTRGLSKAWRARNPGAKLRRDDFDSWADSETGEINIRKGERNPRGVFAHEVGHMVGRGKNRATRINRPENLDGYFQPEDPKEVPAWRKKRLQTTQRQLAAEREANRQAVKLIKQHGGTKADVDEYLGNNSTPSQRKSNLKRRKNTNMHGIPDSGARGAFKTYKDSAFHQAAVDSGIHVGRVARGGMPMRYYRHVYKKHPWLKMKALSELDQNIIRLEHKDSCYHSAKDIKEMSLLKYSANKYSQAGDMNYINANLSSLDRLNLLNAKLDDTIEFGSRGDRRFYRKFKNYAPTTSDIAAKRYKDRDRKRRMDFNRKYGSKADAAASVKHWKEASQKSKEKLKKMNADLKRIQEEARPKMIRKQKIHRAARIVGGLTPPVALVGAGAGAGVLAYRAYRKRKEKKANQ